MRCRLDDLEIDLARQTVERDGKLLNVRGMSFQLFAFLLQRGTRVTRFDELIESVWAPAVVNEETVTQRVRLLRTALEDDSRKPRYIRSVRGQGYQLCAEPRTVKAAPVEHAGLRKTSGLALAAAATAPFIILAALVFQHEPLPPSHAPAAGEVARLIERANYYAGIGQADNNRRAMALYRQALEAEPGNISATLGLSAALSAATCQFDAAPDAAEEAGALAGAILADAPDTAGAHAALAYSYDCRGYIDEAIAAYERAVALDPEGRRDSAASVAHLYAIKGRLADALRLNVHALPQRDELRFVGLQIAHVLDLLGFHVAAEQRYAEEFRLYPDNVFANAAYPAHLFAHGRISDAKAALAEALDRPARPELLLLAGEIHLLKSSHEDARRYFEEASTLRAHMGLPGTLVALHGDEAPDAEWFVARIAAVEANIAAGDRWPDNWLELGLLESHRGQADAAMQALERAVDHGYRNAAYLLASPLFSELRQHRGFAALVDRMRVEVAREREKVLAAEWLPAPLLSASR